MRMSVLVLAMIMASSLTVAHAQAGNRQKMLPVDHEAYSFIEVLFMEQGLAPPNTARPWSLLELAYELDRLAPGDLSDSGIATYRYLRALTDPTRDRTPGPETPEAHRGMQAALSVIAAPEAFAAIPVSVPAAETLSARVHGYEERPAVLTVPLEMWVGDSFYSTTEFSLREEHATDDDAGNYLNVVLDDAGTYVDLYFPFRAYAAIGGDGWSLRFGRDRIDWGNGKTGNMFLSGYSDFYDHAALSLFGESLKFSGVYMVMDSFNPRTHEDTTYSAMVAHRLDVRIGKRLGLALNESAVFGNLEPELLRDTNVFTVFHNWTIPERSNSLLSAEATWTPWRQFSVYGQFAVDEFTTTYEAEAGGGGGPGVFGWLAGINGSYPLGPGYLGAWAEAASTSPWLYNRRASPYYYNVRRYWSIADNAFVWVTKPIGYEYGPDAVVGAFNLDWKVPAGPSVALNILSVTTGQTDILSAWAPAAGDTAPTGDTPELLLAIALEGAFPVLPWLRASAGATWVSRRNQGNLAGADSDTMELYLGLSASTGLPR